MIEQTVSQPQKAILNSDATVNLFLAGVGSGKTFLGGILSYYFIRKFPTARGGIFANTYDQLNSATLFRIREYWSSIGVTEWSRENPSGTYVSGKEPPLAWKNCLRNFDRYNNIISFCNGGLIFTGSLDNAVMHSGKEMAWSILDETKDSREEDVKEVILTRLRQKGVERNGKGWNPLFILTSPAKSDWINEWFTLDKFIDEISAKIYSDKTFFYKAFENKFVTISSTYHNQSNLPEDYIASVLSSNTEERGKALIYANPFSTTGGEFYSSFDRLRHVKELRYNTELSIHITFDQNTVPYNSASIWQVENTGGVWETRCIDEIALENPRNSTEEVCEEFMLRYPNHKAGLFYYGDASGKNRSTMNKDFRHHYEIIEYKLRRYMNNNSDRTLTHNPSIVKRRDFVNLVLEGKLPIRIIVHEECRRMIADLMYTRQDRDGTKDKHIVTDKDTGEKYQKYGHMGDGMEYLLTSLYRDFYDR